LTTSSVDCAASGWCAEALRILDEQGFVTVANVVPQSLIEQILETADRTNERVRQMVGPRNFEQARNRGSSEVRMPFAVEPLFFGFLELPQVHEVVDEVLGPNAILRFQNFNVTEYQQHHYFSQKLHQNFRFHLKNDAGRAVLLEVGFPIGPSPLQFEVVPRSHRLSEPPGSAALESQLRRVAWSQGEMFLFNPFVWHRESVVEAGTENLSVFQQFCQPFIKPHADYCQALGAETLRRLPARTRRLLGEHARLPTRMSDFYLPEEERPYRPGQW
jgi:ectoine hydroxylase-related dioxygenase (phytanoyl-CoA dioxygenase family)